MSPRDEETWRLFVAVPLGEEVRSAAAASGSILQTSLSDAAWRWVDRLDLHVTLAFLGSVSPSAVPDVAERLAKVARESRSMTLLCGGVGAFPSARDARVLWYGVDDAAGKLRSLAAHVRSAVGLPDEAPFRGHITLARVRASRNADVRRRLLVAVPRSRLHVRSIVLYRSSMDARPSRYEALERWPLP